MIDSLQMIDALRIFDKRTLITVLWVGRIVVPQKYKYRYPPSVTGHLLGKSPFLSPHRWRVRFFESIEISNYQKPIGLALIISSP